MNFPNEKAFVSPNLKWAIHCRSEQMQGGEWLHRLLLGPLGATEPTFVYASGRNCDVLWSDDSERIAITDWLGSNVALIFIVEVPTRSVWALEIPDLSKVMLKEELEGHIYWEAMKWEAPNRLLIRIFGHTDEANGHGFTYYFSTDLNSREIALRRLENREAAD